MTPSAGGASTENGSIDPDILAELFGAGRTRAVERIVPHLVMSLIAGFQVIGILLALYASGKIKPYVSAHFPLEKGADAIAHLGGRHAMGKVVITVD